MPLILLRDDITNIKCDVIVNATNTRLSLGGNGIDARLHSVAGPGLIEECKKIGKVGVGKVVVMGAYREFYLSNAQADAKVDGKLKLVDEIEATHIGCEYGEYDE